MLRKAIKETRVNTGWSQEELAKRADVPVSLIEVIESDTDFSVSSKALLRILHVLNLRLADFV